MRQLTEERICSWTILSTDCGSNEPVPVGSNSILEVLCSLIIGWEASSFNFADSLSVRASAAGPKTVARSLALLRLETLARTLFAMLIVSSKTCQNFSSCEKTIGDVDIRKVVNNGRESWSHDIGTRYFFPNFTLVSFWAILCHHFGNLNWVFALSHLRCDRSFGHKCIQLPFVFLFLAFFLFFYYSSDLPAENRNCQ
jgi:hypothetical protein